MSIYEPQGNRIVHECSQLFTTVHDCFCEKGWSPESRFVYLWGKIDKEIKIKVMKNLVIAQRNRDLNVFNFLGEEFCGEGKYRVITKCQAGFLITSVVEADNAMQAFRRYNAKAVHTIARVKEVEGLGERDFTVFARNGKKVWVAEEMLVEFTVGDINQDLYKTALYNQYQYNAVNAKSWADKAYVMNEVIAA